MYLITLYTVKGKFETIQVQIKGNDLIELLAKLPLAVVEFQEKLHQEELNELRKSDDDIPF